MESKLFGIGSALCLSILEVLLECLSCLFLECDIFFVQDHDLGQLAALLKILNEELQNNKENNEEYYSIPKIKRIGETDEDEVKPEKAKKSKEIKETKNTYKGDIRKLIKTLTIQVGIKLNALAKISVSLFSS